MSNVLPPTAQKELWKFHRAHFVLVGSLVLLGGAMLAFLALLPGVIATNALEVHLGTSGLQVSATEEETERNDITRARALVSHFSPIATSSTPGVDAIIAALALRPNKALIQTIRYEEKTKIIQMEGVATDRAAVNAYRVALSEDPRFKDVSVPPGALAGAEGGRFSITFTAVF